MEGATRSAARSRASCDWIWRSVLVDHPLVRAILPGGSIPETTGRTKDSAINGAEGPREQLKIKAIAEVIIIARVALVHLRDR